MIAGWQLPPPPLRASVVRTLTLGSALVVVAGALLRHALPLTPLYPLKALAVYAGMLLVALGYVTPAHPFDRFGRANQITAIRAGLVALAAACLGETPSPGLLTAAIAIGLVATLLDGLDGRAARQSGMASAFGARFDMETDALFVMTLSALAWSTGKAGAWILLAGLLRYLFVLGMQRFAWMRRPEPPSLRRKAICVVLIVGLSLVLLPAFTPPASVWWCAVLLAVLCYSFGVDTLWLWRHRE